jgi:8-oxo-dGTP pyrophosphatase MutT (NUDIX family)
MATTAVVAEILIIGLQACAWIALLILDVFGSRSLDLTGLSGWTQLVTILVIAVAYMVGILADRIADTFDRWLEDTGFGRWFNRVFGERSYWFEAPAGVSEMRLTVMKENEGMARFLDYQRSRVRITRATALNLLMAIPAGAVFLAVRAHLDGHVVAEFCAGIALATFAAMFASERVHGAYIRRLSEAYLLLRPKERKRERDDANVDPCAEGIRDTKVAAVCHQGQGPALRFLLVRTKTGSWTFPKGGIETGEEPQEAAEREAREEAGALGKARKHPFAHYLYPAKEKDRHLGRDYCVAAHLLEVRGETQPTEDYRNPEWFSPKKANQAVGAGDRERRYAREHRRVLRAARKKLARRI